MLGWQDGRAERPSCQGDAAKALEATAKAIELDSAHYLAHRMRGALLKATDPGAALRAFTAAIESNPSFVVGYLERARLLAELGELDRPVGIE